MESKNPIFRNMFSNAENEALLKPMTIEGTANKFCILSILLLIGAALIWHQFTLGRTDLGYVLGMAGMIIGFILAIVIGFKPVTAPALAPIYAICEGALLGWFSFIFEAELPGIVINAVFTTFLAALSVGILFRMRIIRATEKFKSIILAATFAIMLFYLVSFVLMLCGIHLSYFAGANSPIYIAMNVGIALLATFNLVIDLDFIERGQQTGLPETYEWYGAHGLIVTLVWMYIEILRLLARLSKK